MGVLHYLWFSFLWGSFILTLVSQPCPSVTFLPEGWIDYSYCLKTHLAARKQKQILLQNVAYIVLWFQSRALMLVFHLRCRSLSNCFWVWDRSVHLRHSVDRISLQSSTIRYRHEHLVFERKCINIKLSQNMLPSYLSLSSPPHTTSHYQYNP